MEFDEFLADQMPALSAYARALTGSRDAAHDVMADTLFAVHQRWPTIATMVSPGGYVRRMVTTTFLGERRRWSTRKIGLTQSGMVPERSSRADQLAVDDRDELHRLLAKLPRQQRAAVVLRYYLGVSDSEIAAELGCSTSAARTHISRGLAALRVHAGPGPSPGETVDPDIGAQVPRSAGPLLTIHSPARSALPQRPHTKETTR